MAKPQNYNGRYCESEYENAFLSYLEEEGWQYLAGNGIARTSQRELPRQKAGNGFSADWKSPGC